jgi:peptidoglycan hydrolase-like protein with peptidoglycan-binding domain
VRGDSTDESVNGVVETTALVETTVAPVVLVPIDRTLKEGMKGDDVRRVQEQLAALKFDPGPVDGIFGQATKQAVWAFEKLVMQTPRKRATGEVTPSTWVIMQSTAAGRLAVTCRDLPARTGDDRVQGSRSDVGDPYLERVQ